MFTDTDGYAAIARATELTGTAKEMAIIRLYAVAQLFYRQPVGEAAVDALHEIMGDAEVTALFYLCGLSIIMGMSGGNGTETWAKIACIADGQ